MVRHPLHEEVPMPGEESRSVKPWVVAGALAIALGLAAVLGTAAEAPAQEDTTTTAVEAPSDTTDTTVTPDDTTGDTDQEGRTGDPDCDRGGNEDGTDDQGTTGGESGTDV
jgi:hypothetical protein